MKTLIALIALLPLAAGAQPVRMPVCSPWTAWAAETKHNLSASPLQLNALGNLAPISGQRTAVGAIKFLAPSAGVTFKGPAKSSTTGFRVVAIRVHHEMACLNMTAAEKALDHMLPRPLLVPPGQPFACRYDMPLVGYGELICDVGTLATLPPAVPIIPPVVTPPPPPPVVTPPPPPPPVVVGNKMPPATSLADAQGATWTLAPQSIPGENAFSCLRNGVKADHCSALCKSSDGFIYGQDNINGGGRWQRWLNPGWSAHGPTPAGC